MYYYLSCAGIASYPGLPSQILSPAFGKTRKESFTRDTMSLLVALVALGVP